MSFGKLDNVTAAVELLIDKFSTSEILVKSIVPGAVNLRSSKGYPLILGLAITAPLTSMGKLLVPSPIEELGFVVLIE